MIKLEKGKFKFHTNVVEFFRNDTAVIKYTSDINYWIDFINKWDNHKNLKINKLVPTQDQLDRLAEVNTDADPSDAFISELRFYVEHGACTQEPMTSFMQGKKEEAAVVDATINYRKSTKKKSVRDMKKVKEYGGIELNGMFLRTDYKSQNRVTGMATAILGDETVTHIDFEAQEGVFVQLSREEALGVAKAVSDHVQSCFTRSKDLQQTIDALTTAQEVIDFDVEANWEAK